MILVMDVNSRMTGSWMGHEDDRGQVHIEARSHREVTAIS